MFTRLMLFKLFTMVIILLLGLIYAYPSLCNNTLSIEIHYKEDDDNMFKKYELNLFNILKDKKINYVALRIKKRSIFLYFDRIDKQLKTFEELKKILLDKKNTISLSLNTDYPRLFKIFGARPMRLGLDLQGGTHFLLKVDTSYILNKYQSNIVKYFEQYISKNNYVDINIKKIKNYGIQLDSKNIFILDKIQHETVLPRSHLIFFRDSKNVLRINYSNEYKKSIIQLAIEKNIYILKNRIYQLGIAEPVIQQQNSNCIIVELPGFKDSAQVKEILSTNATIEFHLVDTRQDIGSIKNNNVPRGFKLYRINRFNSILLYNNAFITGEHIIDSNYVMNDFNQVEVNVKLDRFGGNIMSNFTRQNIGEYIAILFVEYVKDKMTFDSKNILLKKKESIINIARINSILDNSFSIVGIHDISEAKKLSILLKTGSFIAPVMIVEENIIGPSIGQENVKSGILSCIVSIVLCILIMILRYKKSGVIISIALIANLLLIIAIMSILPGIVLTMPGIASILLTLACSIDANVLINERIREEINNHLCIREAVRKGYLQAYFSILDANVAMLIISIVLYIFGTDIIRNFAITTIVGIFTSLFSSLFITRTIIQTFYPKNKINNFSV
ncbi:MAG: protein translocase subunit SecD [Buchnera aphidicola (Meitanaphis microgallis)]